jgi:hypothetical protein
MGLDFHDGLSLERGLPHGDRANHVGSVPPNATLKKSASKHPEKRRCEAMTPPRDSDSDSDPWRRLRERREAEEAEEQEERREKGARQDPRRAGPGPASSTNGQAQTSASSRAGTPEAQASLLTEATTLLEQVDRLYSLYFNRVERRPPVEARQRLERLIASLGGVELNGAALQFRARGLQSSFATARERWDRLLRELEKAGGRNS